MEQEKLGRIIAETRKERGLTQDDVAKRLGITSQSVSKWERGVNAPDVSLLLDLCEILGIEVDELLSGERKPSVNENIQDVQTSIEVMEDGKKSLKNKKSLVRLSLCCILAVVVMVLVFILQSAFTEEESFTPFSIDDVLVKESLSYMDFTPDVNKNLLQHLFDNNSGVLTKDDLSNDEKMFLLLNKYKKDNGLGTNWYARVDYLEHLIFEDTSFLNDYVKEGTRYTIQNSINYSCYNGVFHYDEESVDSRARRELLFDVLDAKKSKSSLVIDFRIAYVVEYNSFYEDYIYFYKDSFEVNRVDRVLKDELDLGNMKLSEEYHTFRYILKVDGENVYFESLERLGN